MRKQIIGATLSLMTTAGIAQAAVSDNFDDNARGSQWSLVTDDPATLNLAEQNGRLELLSSAPVSPNADAIYLSNFRLSTASDFNITLDYSFDNYQAPAGAVDTALGLVFGIGVDLDGQNSAAIGQGFGTKSIAGFPITAPAATVGYRINDVSAGPDPVLSFNSTGTFEISYIAATDDLTLRETAAGGYSQTLTGLVAGTWHASDLLVSFGGRGNGFSTLSGQASLDNFTLVSGTLTPEPACLTAFVIGALGLFRRRSRVVG